MYSDEYNKNHLMQEDQTLQQQQPEIQTKKLLKQQLAGGDLQTGASTLNSYITKLNRGGIVRGRSFFVLQS